MRDHYVWREYVVASIDVLGQRRQFDRIKAFFIDDIPQKTLDDVASKTIEPVELIRHSLEELFLSSARLAEPRITVAAAEKAEYDKARVTSPIRFQFYSDSILAYIALRVGGYQLNDLFAIRDVLVSVGGTLLMTLARQSSFRASIQLGTGTELKNGDLYGPVRAEAYELEKRAGYPRIVMGDRLFRYLKSFSEEHPQIPCNTERELLGCKTVAEACLRMISEDPNDDLLILDYLANEFRNFLKDSSLAEACYDMAREYVEKELHERIALNDTEVVDKFTKLHKYFSSRLPRI